ncbi:hypothetical protein [Paracoccus sp. DMF]|uniref:hypothetical protein n=1 Tax=Paracoccus sp. DMF TaxID=400837 RepID=UPI0011049572|nr:hypothetical protein [Paracoccus sp. DMF]MCV2449515.1 hypothetical protein [Paracoccus sp. DMF]
MQFSSPTSRLTPEEMADCRNTGGRICDLESTPGWRCLALALMVVTALGFALLVKFGLEFVVTASDEGPSACAGLNPSDCSARAAEGW